jgi:hypothetical protein
LLGGREAALFYFGGQGCVEFNRDEGWEKIKCKIYYIS